MSEIFELRSEAELAEWVAGIDDRIDVLARRSSLELDFSADSISALGEWIKANFATSSDLTAEPGQPTLQQYTSYIGEVYRRRIWGVAWAWKLCGNGCDWVYLLMPDGGRYDVTTSATSRLAQGRPAPWGATLDNAIAARVERYKPYADAGQTARNIGYKTHFAFVFTTRVLDTGELKAALEESQLPVNLALDHHTQVTVDDWSLNVHPGSFDPKDEAGSALQRYCSGKSKKPPEGGELSDFDAYTTLYTVAGGEDPNMDHFNDWLFAIEAICRLDPHAVWHNTPAYK